MNALFAIVSVVLPLLPVVLFPTRFIGRGLGGTLLGAALIVGMMLLVYWGLSGLGGDDGKSDAALAAQAGLSDADMKALDKLLGN